MAFSIVAQGKEVACSSTRIERTTTCRYDVFTGPAEALILEGVITPNQLQPQAGRKPGITAFLPSGEPCPTTVRAWRDPGFKYVRRQPDGSYRVEVTVPNDAYLFRRSVEQRAKHKKEQARSKEAFSEHGHKYRDWTFLQIFEGRAETWEGTKSQLQAAGLGVGLRFPGEPGAEETLRCRCPLGFDFVIGLPESNLAKREARIYTAYSRYVPRRKLPTQYETYAPGVQRVVWSPEGYRLLSHFYEGTAEALVAAGLIPDVGYFPGMPGVCKTQATYLKNWQPASNSRSQDWGLTIRKRGASGRFSVEVPLEEQEVERRKTLVKAREAEIAAEELQLSTERRRLRQVVAPEKTIAEFRVARSQRLESLLELLLEAVFERPDGLLCFGLPQGSEDRNAIGHAFQTLRDVVKRAPVLRDGKACNANRPHLKLAAVGKDKSPHALLKGSKHLKLVPSGPADEQC